MFKKLDTSKDGILDKEEIQNGMTEIMEMFHIDLFGSVHWNGLVAAVPANGLFAVSPSMVFLVF